MDNIVAMRIDKIFKRCKTNLLLVLALIVNVMSVMAQRSYDIRGFSDKYHGIVSIDKGYEDEVFKKGNISIFDTKSGKKLISIDSEELTFSLDSLGNVESNVMEIPYGEQSIIICDDFNFDGKNDLAIMDGQFSCYHLPSFQIYLESDEGLEYSHGFTQLAHEYCGMFNIDKANKKIYTMTKDGCCWHQFSEFTVEENKPVVQKIIEEGRSSNGLTWDFVEKTRVGNKMVEKSYSVLNDNSDMELVFVLHFKNDKTMQILKASDYEDILFYVFKDKEDIIELLFTGDFVYNKKNNTLHFTNNDVNYTIYDKGILIDLPNRKVDLIAIDFDKDTSLLDLRTMKVSNLVVR